MKYQVFLSEKLSKKISKLPAYIVAKLLNWIEMVELLGLEETRKQPGYHDEPLKGDWFGYRSIRLNRSYRAIYKMEELEIRLVRVVEVTKHEY